MSMKTLPKLIPVILAIIVIAGISAAFLYFQNSGQPQKTQETAKSNPPAKITQQPEFSSQENASPKPSKPSRPLNPEVFEIEDADFENTVKKMLDREPYETAVIQETSIDGRWGKLVHFDNGKIWKLMPKSSQNTGEIPLLSLGKYKSQKNLREIRIQNADFNGDGTDEKIISFVSDDELFMGETRINGHLKIIDDAGKILKEDIAPQGKGLYHPSVFETIEVLDFGNDGNEELFVKRRNPIDEATEDDKYYVFGFVNGEFTDYAISKGYLHTDEYVECEENTGKLNLYTATPSPKGILEEYYYYDHCDEKGKDLEIFQRYKNGEFTAEIATQVWMEAGSEQEHNYHVKDGYLWNYDEKLLDQKLDDIIEHKGEGILDYTVQYENETDQFTDIYLTDGAGCGGCVWFLPTYLRVYGPNSETSHTGEYAVEKLELNKEDCKNFLGRGIPISILISPDGKRVAFFFYGYEEPDELWIYDFEKQKEKFFMAFQKEETVVSTIEGTSPLSTAIHWEPDSKTIIIKPFQKEEFYEN